MKSDGKRLIEMVRRGIPDKEIMRELGVQTKASLKRMYYDVLVEAGKIRDIMTQIDEESSTQEKSVEDWQEGNHSSEQGAVGRSAWLR